VTVGGFYELGRKDERMVSGGDDVGDIGRLNHDNGIGFMESNRTYGEVIWLDSWSGWTVGMSSV
jgi:hypothetical protein